MYNDVVLDRRIGFDFTSPRLRGEVEFKRQLEFG